MPFARNHSETVLYECFSFEVSTRLSRPHGSNNHIEIATAKARLHEVVRPFLCCYAELRVSPEQPIDRFGSEIGPGIGQCANGDLPAGNAIKARNVVECVTDFGERQLRVSSENSAEASRRYAARLPLKKLQLEQFLHLTNRVVDRRFSHPEQLCGLVDVAGLKQCDKGRQALIADVHREYGYGLIAPTTGYEALIGRTCSVKFCGCKLYPMCQGFPVNSGHHADRRPVE